MGWFTNHKFAKETEGENKVEGCEKFRKISTYLVIGYTYERMTRYIGRTKLGTVYIRINEC